MLSFVKYNKVLWPVVVGNGKVLWPVVVGNGKVLARGDGKRKVCLVGLLHRVVHLGNRGRIRKEIKRQRLKGMRIYADI